MPNRTIATMLCVSAAVICFSLYFFGVGSQADVSPPGEDEPESGANLPAN